MSAAWQESALAFDCLGQQLIGVLARPAAGAAPAHTGVVIVTGGPQYRAGAHRLFVRLSRALAGAGHAALRFDLRGMGDSEGDFPGFEHVAPDIGAAIDTLQAQCPGLRRVLLWGLCDGASAALLYLHATGDARVRGLCLLNPWVRSDQGLARTQLKHYYTRRLLQRGFWRKLLRGGIGARALRELAGSARRALGGRGTGHGDGARGGAQPGDFRQRMARAWNGFDGELLLLLSGEDYTAREFLEHCAGDAAWRAALGHARLQRATLPGADHTFSTPAASAWVLERTLAWLQPRPAQADVPQSRPGAVPPQPCA